MHWYLTAADLEDCPGAEADLGSRLLGSANVTCTVHDCAGNGKMDEGDYITLVAGWGTSFSATTNYTMMVMYEPMGAQICTTTFHG